MCNSLLLRQPSIRIFSKHLLHYLCFSRFESMTHNYSHSMSGPFCAFFEVSLIPTNDLRPTIQSIKYKYEQQSKMKKSRCCSPTTAAAVADNQRDTGQTKRSNYGYTFSASLAVVVLSCF